MAIVLRHGEVARLRTEGRPRGRGGRVSVAMFQLDGFPAEYEMGNLAWGADPPSPTFQEGDSIVASGNVKQSGLFDIYALHVPLKKLTVSRKSLPDLSGGILLLAMSAVFSYFVHDKLAGKGFTIYLGVVVLSFSVAATGALVIMKGASSLAARRMIVAAAKLSPQ